jgi:hypothetical protein
MTRRMDNESSSGPVNYYELKELLDGFVWMRMVLAIGVPENMLQITKPSSFALAKEQERTIAKMAKIWAIARMCQRGEIQ